jgi:leucyl/phenylalanyl-tRNA--protein transferase
MPLFRLTDDISFPPPRLAIEGGLLAVGGDLGVERLVLAYRSGIFPWYSEGDPLLWWSPDPRMVLFPDKLHVARSLERVLKKGTFTTTMDTAFDPVIRACVEMRGPKRDGTWITADMVDAYCALHEAGYAHSVECWKDGQLAGGLYGVSLGACFFGESMFSHEPNASKVAFVSLVRQVAAWGFSLVDCQMHTPHLERFGAQEIPRKRFLALLRDGLKAETRRGPWRFGGK